MELTTNQPGLFARICFKFYTVWFSGSFEATESCEKIGVVVKHAAAFCLRLELTVTVLICLSFDHLR